MGDYSCTFTIHNALDVSLRRMGQTAPVGYWLRGPDRTIGGLDDSDEMQIKDNSGLLGTDGTVTYKAKIGGVDVNITIYVACPFGKANIARINSSDTSLVAVSMGSMDGSDHPLLSEYSMRLAVSDKG